jgi:Hydrazine synthase alpha subunit middle domain
MLQEEAVNTRGWRTAMRLTIDGIRSAIALAMLIAAGMADAAINYDIVYVRQPRFGDTTYAIWPEVFHPARLDPGADLILRHPDGSEAVLVVGGNGGVTDPVVSFDAQWVYYAYYYDLRESELNFQRNYLPYRGADLFRIRLSDRHVDQLTHGEFTPNTGAGHWDESNPLDPPGTFDRLGYGILNLAPCPLPGNRIAFVSNRNGFEPPKGYTSPTLQLYVMDGDGQNVTQIAPMNISSALHPTVLRDGRIAYSTHEDQGLRDTRMWGIWTIQPDGRYWKPLVSAFRDGQAFHFMTQMGNDDIVLVDYYNLNNNGFGTLYRMPYLPPPGQPAFFSAFAADNPDIARTVGAGFSYPMRMPFTPRGLYSIAPFTHGDDEAAPIGAGNVRVGKFTQPSAAPNGDLLVVWSPGPANDLDRPTALPRLDAGIYLAPGGAIIGGPASLTLIKNDPGYNEAWPRAVVSYRAIHGVDQPAELAWLPNDGSEHAQLPAGTPYGLIGTSSFYKRESFPGESGSATVSYNGLDVFNTAENGQSSNWGTQGSDAGKYTNADIWAVRIVAMEPHSHHSYGPHEGRHFTSHAEERLRILGEIPLRKTNGQGQPVLDAEGNPDTSFLARIPADTPFTFQMLDRNGMVLTTAQTWHQLRPGEVRNDCGGCHAHSQQPLAFAGTAAAQAGYNIFDLSKVTPLLTQIAGQPALRIENLPVVNVEFLRDIRPLLQRSCVSCHQGTSAAGNLNLADLAQYNGLPGDYARLAADSAAQWGYAPVIGNHSWRQTNTSRYVRAFQSRRSLLIWKVFGQRLDGWSNADHPTESVPGNGATLPAGADPNLVDLDYTGTLMPPPGSGATPLSDDEKFTFARWVDLGCPIDLDNSGFGWFLDDLKPSVNISLPRAGQTLTPVTLLRFGLADADSGIDLATLAVSADFPVAGRAPGVALGDLVSNLGDGIYGIALAQALPALTNAHLRVSVRDHQGNITRVERAFSTTDRIFASGFDQ